MLDPSVDAVRCILFTARCEVNPPLVLKLGLPKPLLNAKVTFSSFVYSPLDRWQKQRADNDFHLSQ